MRKSAGSKPSDPVYVPPQFREERREVLHAAIEAAPFANLVTIGEAGLDATPLPLLLDPEAGTHGTLIGHIARANPQWRTASPEQEALIIFSGPDGYITPSWYETKRLTGKVVPTWNYVTIHARGRLTFFHEPDSLLDVVRRLTERHEAARAIPWAVADAPDDFIAGQLRGIVGLRLEITALTGKWKMSQNRAPADIKGVIEGLRADGDIAALSVADAVENTRQAR